MTGVVVLLVALVAAGGFGVLRKVTDGRFKTAATPPPTSAPASASTSVLAGTPWETELGEQGTLLQFSSSFCAPCRATRQVLGQVAAQTPGVVHLEIDAEAHLDVVRRLGILRTPTTLVLGPSGEEITRASGAPRADQVRAALAGPTREATR